MLQPYSVSGKFKLCERVFDKALPQETNFTNLNEAWQALTKSKTPVALYYIPPILSEPQVILWRKQ